MKRGLALFIEGDDGLDKDAFVAVGSDLKRYLDDVDGSRIST